MVGIGGDFPEALNQAVRRAPALLRLLGAHLEPIERRPHHRGTEWEGEVAEGRRECRHGPVHPVGVVYVKGEEGGQSGDTDGLLEPRVDGCGLLVEGGHDGGAVAFGYEEG